jgi:hypothetical protein
MMLSYVGLPQLFTGGMGEALKQDKIHANTPDVTHMANNLQFLPLLIKRFLSKITFSYYTYRF